MDLLPLPVPERSVDDRWRQTHLGRLLGHSMRRFDERVLQLMAGNEGVPLALAHLAARDQVSAAHIHITRHLALTGSRLTELAQAAGMSKQAMGALVDQCVAWGLVRREPDGSDGRARRVVFTDTGHARPRRNFARPWAQTSPPWWHSGWKPTRTALEERSRRPE
jgi:DNA-binding MarR family transcriptional regulator